MAQSLEQLKQENARAEADALTNEPAINKEPIVDEYVEEEPEALAASNEAQGDLTNDTDDLDGEVAAEKPVELWMQDEEQTSSNNDNESFGSSDMAKLRRKLKAKNDEKDDEIAQLNARIANMENGQSTNNAPKLPEQQSLARPKLEDFDYDEDRFNNAIDDYYIARMSQQNTKSQGDAQQEQVQKQFQQDKQQKLDSHYEQVTDLITSKTLTAEMYQNSEIVLRKALDTVSKGNGDDLTDIIIAQLSSLGEGSAKVITHLGRNATNRNRLVNALAEDNTGLKAMGILGELKATLTSAPAQKISTAPTPSARLSGGEGGGDSSAKLARKYKEAHKRGDAQSAFNIKQEAKAAKINTRNWS